ncbi:MAG: protein kinase [Planctomycetota bacterium]
MITAEDLALAQSLLASGRVDATEIEKALASLGAENSGKRLKEVLAARGLLQSDGAAKYGATIVPGSLVGEPQSADGSRKPVAVPETFDRTIMASGSGKSLPSPQPDPAVRPARRIGRFELMDEIARGGMGIVYRAFEPALNRHVALKVLIAGQNASDDQVQRFIREARAAAGLHHPNIVQVFEVGEETGSHWFAMELVDGASLDKIMKQQGSFPPRTALRIARDIARALHFAHQKGIVHRDVKPGNIMVASSGKGAASSVSGDARPMRVLLGDFGLARDASAGAGLTLSGNLLGTPAYMSPEQASGRTKDIDAQSDVFGLGSVLYELLCGKPPFQASSLGDILSMIMGSDAPPLRKARPGLHRDIELIVSKAMAKEKARRYATAGDFADDIDRYLNGEAILAEAPSAVYRVVRWSRVHAPLAVAGTVALVALIAMGGILLKRAWNRRMDDRQRQEAASRELQEKVTTALREAVELANAGEFGEADVRLAAARKLEPGNSSIEAAARHLKLAFLIKRVGEVAAKPDPSEEEVAIARSLLAMHSDLAGDPDVRRMARQVEGTCSWSLASDVEGLEVDLASAEPGIYWDEETFPRVAEARGAGLCKRIGEAPVAPQDAPYGEYLIILSREGHPVRIIPMNLRRNTTAAMEHRVLRVGKSPDATHSRVEDALFEARAGNSILLENEVFGGIEVHSKPGLLIGAIPGARPALSNSAGHSIYASDCYGIRLRDLTITSVSGTICSLTTSSRASVIRCRATVPGSAGLGALNSGDWHARDSVFMAGQAGYGIHSDRLPGCLAFRVTVEGGGWCSVVSAGDRARFIQCRFSKGQLAAMTLQGPDSELVECEFRDCPNWGVLTEGRSERALIRDCHFVQCGARPSSSVYAGALVVSNGGIVEHNTFAGCAFAAITFLGSGSIRDNLFAPVLDFTKVDGGVLPGGPVFLRGDEDGPCLEGNFYASSTLAGRVRETKCSTEEVFAREAAGMNCPIGKAPPLRNLDAPAAATLLPEGGLAPGSPLLTAATDGGPVGVRFNALAADTIASEEWMKRDIGRLYAWRGTEALNKGDRAAAAHYLAKAHLMAASDPAVNDLAARLK